MKISDQMISAAARALQMRLSARLPLDKRRTWAAIRPSIRKQYLDIAHDMLKAADKSS